MKVTVALRRFSDNTHLTSRAAREQDPEKFAELTACHRALAEQVEALRERLKSHRLQHRC